MVLLLQIDLAGSLERCIVDETEECVYILKIRQSDAAFEYIREAHRRLYWNATIRPQRARALYPDGSIRVFLGFFPNRNAAREWARTERSAIVERFANGCLVAHHVAGLATDNVASAVLHGHVFDHDAHSRTVKPVEPTELSRASSFSYSDFRKC